MPWLSHPGCPAGGLWWPHETWTTWFPSWLHLPRLLSRSCITSQGSFICFENMMSPVLSLAKGKNCGHNAECASGKLGRNLGATGKQTAADVTNLRNEHGSLMLFAAFSLESLGVTRCISWHWVILETLMQQNHFRHWWIQKVLR